MPSHKIVTKYYYLAMLKKYEDKYSMSSDEFYERFMSGERFLDKTVEADWLSMYQAVNEI